MALALGACTQTSGSDCFCPALREAVIETPWMGLGVEVAQVRDRDRLGRKRIQMFMGPVSREDVASRLVALQDAYAEAGFAVVYDPFVLSLDVDPIVTAEGAPPPPALRFDFRERKPAGWKDEYPFEPGEPHVVVVVEATGEDQEALDAARPFVAVARDV